MTESQSDGLPVDYDASFLRDIADIVKNRTLFFIPFFGAVRSTSIEQSHPDDRSYPRLFPFQS
jgi:hypothetical protein